MPVNWLTFVAVYVVVWWLCMFVVLPIGVRTQDEEGNTTLGTVGSAPARPMLGRKVLAVTVLAAVVVALLWLAIDQFDITLQGASRIFE